MDSTLSTMVSTSIPGLRERRSNEVPLATAEATSEGSVVRVTVRATAFTVCQHTTDSDGGEGEEAQSIVRACYCEAEGRGDNSESCFRVVCIGWVYYLSFKARLEHRLAS